MRSHPAQPHLKCRRHSIRGTTCVRTPRHIRRELTHKPIHSDVDAKCWLRDNSSATSQFVHALQFLPGTPQLQNAGSDQTSYSTMQDAGSAQDAYQTSGLFYDTSASNLGSTSQNFYEGTTFSQQLDPTYINDQIQLTYSNPPSCPLDSSQNFPSNAVSTSPMCANGGFLELNVSNNERAPICPPVYPSLYASDASLEQRRQDTQTYQNTRYYSERHS